MKLSFLFSAAALLLLLVGCGEPEQNVHLFYSNGIAVVDSVHQRALSLEVDKIIQERGIKQNDIYVYSSLRGNFNPTLRAELAPVEEEIYQNMNWKRTRNPNFRKEIDRLRKEDKFFDAAVVALDNQTGQIVAYFSTYGDETTDGVTTPAPIGSLQQTFSFAQGLQREYTPFDFYPRFDSYSNTPDPDFKRPFYRVLEMGSPTYAQGLDRRYTQQQSEEFLQQFEIRHGRLNDPVFRFKTTMPLLDVTKAYAAFYTKGVLHRPSLVDSITDSKGKLLYKRKTDTKQALDAKTAEEIMQVLAYNYSYEPRDELYHQQNVPGFIGQFKALEARFDGNGWFIAITEDYTIGVRNFVASKDVSYPKKDRHMQLRDRTFPLWIRTLEMLRKDTRSVPALRTFDLSGMTQTDQ